VTSAVPAIQSAPLARIAMAIRGNIAALSLGG